MPPLNQVHGSGYYLNRPIYNRRSVLVWPELTAVTPDLLEQADKLGISITPEDLEPAGRLLFRIADKALDELGEVFRIAGETGKIRVGELRESVIAPLIDNLTADKLMGLLVHLGKKDNPTLRHSIGVCALSVMLGRWLNMAPDELEDLALAALLHDIGKLRIRKEILNKPGKLTPEEYEEVKRHVMYGFEMLLLNKDVPERCALAALNHHERYDGSGYPHGRAGEDIDAYSRIIAVADVFHAMSSRRSYKEPASFYRVIREMRSSMFGDFDPYIGIRFLKHMMESLIGCKVLLSTGETARVVALDSRNPIRPLVEANGRFLNLAETKDIEIIALAE